MRIALYILILLLPTSLLAQESLSLGSAVRVGLANNFDIRISEKRVEQASNNNTYGMAGGLPTLTVGLDQQNSYNEQDNPASFIQGSFSSNNIRPYVDVNWTAFNGFKIQITKDKLDLLQEQSNFNAAIIVENTIQAVIMAYYQAVVQQKKLSVLDELKTLSREEYELFSYKRELGSEATFDLLQVKNAYLNDSTNFLNQELALKNAKRNLNLLMAVDLNSDYVLTDTVLPPVELYNIEVLEEKMMSNNRTLKNQYINQEILMKDVGISKADLYPVVSLRTGLSETLTRFTRDTLSVNGRVFNFYANVALSYRLYDGGRIRTALNNTRISEEIGELTTEQMMLSLQNDLYSTYDAYNTRLQMMGIAQLSLETAALNLKIGQEKFNQGVLNSFNFRDIQLSYLLANISLLESALNVINEQTQLIRLTGGIIDQYE